jgi:hypothetical protein
MWSLSVMFFEYNILLILRMVKWTINKNNLKR